LVHNYRDGLLVSIGFFFSIVTLGLAAALPFTLYTGLTTNGVPSQAATTIAHLPPTAALFGAFLGYNPIGELARGMLYLGGTVPDRGGSIVAAWQACCTGNVNKKEQR
jgi:hypothetical protein